MSEYIQVEVEFRDEAALMRSLEEMGYDPQITKHPCRLEGYQGDKRKEQAHIIIPRHQVGHLSNDVGFERMNDGSLKAHISEYDIGGKFDLPRLKQRYTTNIVKGQAKLRGWRVEEKQRDGKVVLNVITV
jgi:hypothetical protein